MSDITNFVQMKLYPALFSCVDRAFPEMSFKRYKGGWASPYKLNGERSHDGRSEKSRITEKVPNRIFEQGDERNSKDLISFYMERNNIDEPINAIRKLASICGLELPPMGDKEGYRRWQEKQERAERAASEMEAALYTDEGAATLNYLREGRGYSDEFIRYARFGFVSPSIAKELREIFQEGSTFPYGVGSSHTLAIPFVVGGDIKGFIFRTINPEYKPKYLYIFLSKKASQKYYLFGLTGLKLTGDGERDRDITIVEGQIDALRASFAGLPNVVAGGGVEVYPEALKEAKARGVKRATLLLDADEAGQSSIEKAIGSIQAEGLKCYVACLPSDGEKVDVDSYLRDHTPEELKKIVDEALPASRWLFYQLAEKEKYQDGLTPKLLEDYKSEVIAICNSRYTSPTDRDIILREASESTQSHITREALQEEADLLKLAEEKSLQKQEAVALTSEALTLANNGSVEEALTLLREKLPDLTQISREAEYSSLLHTPTIEEIKNSFKEKPAGVETNYYFSNQNEEQERLILPVGGLTYVCAPTSHGKSRFLENLALQLTTDGKDGSVLYFSFEEDMTAVELQLLNIYANMPLSRNNLRTLNSYYRTGKEYFANGTDINEFKQKEAEFFSLLSSGKLRVYYKDYDSTDLIEAIRYLTKQTKVKAVMVDYIQLLHTRGSRLQRREELGEMCKNLWRLATETSIPIVLAAQLNREAYSPLDMTSQNIAEAADIERSANVMILLWNSSFYPTPQKSSYYRTSKGEQVLTDEAEELEGRNGFFIGTSGKIYAKITKNRGGEPNMDAVLDFNGNTGKISENPSEPQPKQVDPSKLKKDYIEIDRSSEITSIF